MANVNGVHMSPQYVFVSDCEKRKYTTSPLVVNMIYILNYKIITTIFKFKKYSFLRRVKFRQLNMLLLL